MHTHIGACDAALCVCVGGGTYVYAYTCTYLHKEIDTWTYFKIHKDISTEIHTQIHTHIHNCILLTTTATHTFHVNTGGGNAASSRSGHAKALERHDKRKR